MRVTLLLVAAVAVLPARRAAAQEAPSTAPTLEIGGYLEAYYQYNANDPSNRITAYRGFDNRAGSFTLSNAALDLHAQTGDVSTHLVLQIGHTPASYYGSEPAATAQAGTGPSDARLWRMIQQAVIGYRIGKLEASAGIFLSPVGLESLAVKDDWNWSRSDLFFALPFYHAGVRLVYPVAEHVTGAVYVTNGWNDIVGRNGSPSLAASLAYAPSSAVSMRLLYFGGNETPDGAPQGKPWRHLFDLIGTWQLAPDLEVAMQADGGFEQGDLGTDDWYDAAAYVRIHPTRRLYVAARVDTLHEDGVRTDTGEISRLFFPSNDVSSGTLTADWRPTSNLSLRAEYRYDRASAPIYFHGDVKTNVTTGLDLPSAHSQQTLTLGAVSWF